MKSIFRIVALLSLLSGFAFATANVSGTIKDPSGAVVPNSFVRFELANTNNNQCAVAGVTLGKRLVDFTANTTTGAVSGTLYRTDTEISCGGFFTSRYNMTLFRKGVPDGPSKCVIVNGDFNIASPIYCTAQVGAPALPAPSLVQTNPVGSQTVVQPAGTSLTVSGDAAVTGTTTLNNATVTGTATLNNATVTGTLTAPSLNSVYLLLSRVRTQRLTSCSVAVGSACQTAITWSTTFADASYTTVCNVESATNQGYISNQAGRTAAGLSVSWFNVAGTNPTTVTLNCIAVHD